jgi:hypothetical protein
MKSASPDDWRAAAARATLPDGTSVPDRVSDAILDFLQSASRAPLKSTELDAAAGSVLAAWSLDEGSSS